MLANLDKNDALRPTALVWLAGAVGYRGRIAEARALAEAARAEADRLGPEFDFDGAEALWILCSAGYLIGRPDYALASELLSFARRLGNARAIAGGLIQVGIAEPDPVRGAALLAEARDLAARTRDNFRNGLATGWLGALQAEVDPRRGLVAIRGVLDLARRTGSGLLTLTIPRSYFGAFAALGRYSVIAVLDGVVPNTAIHPAAAAAAIDSARNALGVGRYDELKRQGSAMTVDDVAEFLLAAVDDL